MFRFVASAALALVLLPSTSFAQFGGTGGAGMMMGGGFMPDGPAPSWPGQRWQVKVETVTGKSVTGTLTLNSVAIDCDLGRYYIKPENIKTIRFAATGEHQMMVGPSGAAHVRGTVTPKEGEEIEGTVIVKSWAVETDLGQLTLFPAKLRSITLTRKVETPVEPVKIEVKVEEKVQKK